METKLYLMDCHPLEDGALFARALLLASNARRARATSYDAPGDRALSLGAGLLLDWALRREDVSGRVLRGDNGKPLVEGRPDVFVSLSHSSRFAMCGLSASPIGVDVQVYKGAMPSIIRRFFHPEEQARLAALPGDRWEEAFYSVWCRKECYIKLHGRAELTNFSVFSPETGRRYEQYPLDGYACWSYRDDGGDAAPLEQCAVETVLEQLARR